MIVVIVIEPKSGLYLDDPVACVEYSSLYPSYNAVLQALDVA